MKKFFAQIVLLFIVIGGILYYSIQIGIFQGGFNTNKESATQKLQIKNIILEVEVADTKEERAKGLSERVSLPLNKGMLFVFPSPGMYAFWMKDMLFPIDIIWIKNNTVVGLLANVPPAKDENPVPTYKPNAEVDEVLEVNVGFIEKYGITVGDRVELNN